MNRIVVAGGGAAGFFAAIRAADLGGRVTLLEKGPEFLQKVRISGGGRCNVTHACFEPRALASHYPRGERALIGAFQRFQPRDTVEWFAKRGLPLKTEPDGRMFPITDTSESVIDCFLQEAKRTGVQAWTRRGIVEAKREGREFVLVLTNGETLRCDRLLLATGGCRSAEMGNLPVALGHTLVAPVPSLFSFHVDSPWLREIPGVALEAVEASVPGTKLRERGPVLVTHWGVSGPVILRLSAWGARLLHDGGYQFDLQVNWLPGWNRDQVMAEFQRLRAAHPSRLVVNSPIAPIPGRLWEKLLSEAGIGRETQWTRLPREGAQQLAGLITGTVLPVSGKSLNKDEFVTCGGVPLREVDFKTMESRICPGLYFAGELLDVDGITGGFNFQAAWTTGWIAGRAMALG